jgi:cyanophycinase-like exopeptidase
VTPSHLALFGPGDWSPWSIDVFNQLRRGDGPALLISFGAAEMGPDMVATLRAAAVEHLNTNGIEHVIVDSMDRDGLDSDENIGRLTQAGFLYVQGGNPRYLVDHLANTRFLAEAQRLDVPWVGTSGSAMAAGDRAPDLAPGAPWVDGLKFRPGTNFAAHWDTYEDRRPGFHQAYITETGDEKQLIALDEETAILSMGKRWHVFGERSVHVLAGGDWSTYRAGDSFSVQ